MLFSDTRKKSSEAYQYNLFTHLGVHLLGSEYSTGKNHGGRIETIGIDENGCPVIIEYKRTMNENVINQGLFYFDCLLDHKAEFKLLVMEALGKDIAERIEWSSPRLIFIAGDFTKCDTHVVQIVNRNIELIRYAHYGKDLLMLEGIVNIAEPESDYQTDSDNDGYTSNVDCDETDPQIYPEASEISYDGINQDCDGEDAVIDQDQDGIDSLVDSYDSDSTIYRFIRLPQPRFYAVWVCI